MRKRVKILSQTSPDYLYDSMLVSKLINQIMEGGKKNTARKIVYDALDIAKKETKKEPLAVLEEAIENVSPSLEVRSRRVGGANYQVPREVRPERRIALALRWIHEAAKAKKGKRMAEKLAEELMLAAKSDGIAFKRKENTHRMAEANRAFAHFAW